MSFRDDYGDYSAAQARYPYRVGHVTEDDDETRRRKWEICRQTQAIVEGADARAKDGEHGTLTEEESAKVDALYAEYDRLSGDEPLEHYTKAHHDAIMVRPAGRVAGPNPVYRESDEHPSRPPLSEWRDERGAPIPVAAQGESVLGTLQGHRLIGGRVAPDLSVGRMVKSMLTGDWADAQPEAASVGDRMRGGYLLNPVMSASLIDLARSASVVFAAGAKTVVMPRGELIMVRQLSDPTPAWTAENQKIPASEPSFGRLTFRAKKLAARVVISRELVEDAPNAAQVIEGALRNKMAESLDRMALLGSGDGEEPVGLFSAADVNEQANVGPIDYDHFLDAIQAVEMQNGSPNAVVMNPSTKSALSRLKSSDGQYLAPPPLVAELPGYRTTALSESQAAVGDFEQMMIGIRSGMQLEASTHGDAFRHDQVEIKARWRGDVQFAHPEFFSKLTGIDNS